MPIRRRRRLVALGLAWSLLCAPWALAVHVCPPEQRAAAMARATPRAAGLPCDETDGRAPCHPHMAQAAQCSETTKTPLPAPPDVALMTGVPATAVEPDADAVARIPHAAAQGPPAQPVYLATQRLRV